MAKLTELSLGLLWFAALPLAAQDAPVAQPATPLAPPPDTSSAPVAPPAAAAETTPGTNVPGGLVVTTPAAAQFDSAMAFFNSGDYVDAVPALSSFIGNFPQERRREEALFRLGESYRALKRLDDALAAYTYQVQTYPEGPLRANAELRRGAILFDQQKFGEAIAPLHFVAEKGEPSLQEAANYLLARALLATDNAPQAVPLLQALAAQQPAGKFTGQAAQALAEIDDKQEKFSEALPLWQKALSLATDPADKATTAARGGWSALQARRPDDAEKLFQIARKNDPAGEPRKVANTGLLRVLFQQKRYAEWVALYNAELAHTLESALAEILYDYGHAQFALKHWKEAAAGFDQYLAAYGSQPSAITAAYERFLAGAQIEPAKTPAQAEDYLKAYPDSPYANRVRLLEAQEFSREKNYTAALPIWEALVDVPDPDPWPHLDILLERARAADELQLWNKAAPDYQAYLDELGPVKPGSPRLRRLLDVLSRQAFCYQSAGQSLAATNTWKELLSQAPAGSPDQRTALESLGLIYAKDGPAQEPETVATFRELLDRFPDSPLRALADFTVGNALFKAHDYIGAEPLLLDARTRDPKSWQQPATQRLALAAFGRSDNARTVGYVKEYDALPAPADPQAALAARLPAALFYWLAETARKAGKLDEAETWYRRVTQHPDPGDLLAGAWYQLGEVQSARKEWTSAVASYEQYRQLKPADKDATVVLLALGRARLGTGDFESARKLGEQALLQEPEGPRSARARMLLGETAFAAGNFPDAARQFATLAVLFDDPQITPQAEARAADSFDRAGDAKSAGDWRAKLRIKYPGYAEVIFL